MVSSQQWAQDFTITADDVDYLMNLLLEREVPLSSQQLALALIQQRIEQEAAALQDRYKDVQVYNPTQTYDVGQRLIFPALAYETASVVRVREGNNPDYGDFSVIGVQFPDNPKTREFAAGLAAPHALSDAYGDDAFPIPGVDAMTPEEILEEYEEEIVPNLEDALIESGKLVHVARKWFPRDLMLGVDEGHLNLAEAVLVMAEGGPLKTEAILDQIGGIGSSPMELQAFSANYALNEDPRFDEVGPAGEVLWYLVGSEPEDVRHMPEVLRYAPVEYDRGLLTPEMLTLEQDLGDELSPIPSPGKIDKATVILIYPHRRAGTFPLNAAARRVFPKARRAPRIFVTLVDGQDGEEFTGWVVNSDHYVYGLNPFYSKHKIPIGAYVTVSRHKEPGKIIIDYNAYRPRTEYVRLMNVDNNQLQIESIKRAIGADYDDLMLIGVDDLDAISNYAQYLQQHRRTLAAIMKLLIPPLGRLTPQGTVHARTLYSAVNVLRRCPPGPILATLRANPDFENVGGHYWRLTEDA